jgi:diacylglycerol diphosphate phosphatase/phosphatidate phosphatase
MVPTLGAALIAGSRIMDARHHPFDVLTGGALGMLVAWGSYRQYFPPVSETWRKGRAYPIRAWGREPQAPQNPAFRVDEDTEPLRPMGRPTDVEDRGAASGFSSETVVGGAADAPAGNVFRQQIHQSQRRRQEQGGGFTIPHSDTMQSTMSGRVARYQGQMPNSNPFAGDARRDDGYDYSSSDEEESYELRSQTGGVYNPVAGTFADTGYHPPTGVTPAPTPPPANVGAPRHLPPASSTSGDIGETMPTAPPAVPPHATGTTL